MLDDVKVFGLAVVVWLFGNERGVGTAQNQRESAVGVHSARLEHAISW
jgi:hypothetical protein